MSNLPKDDPIIKELYAKALGDYIMNYIKPVTPEDMLYYMQLNTVTLLSQVKAILDDESLDDPTCFRRIDAIVSAFHKQGVGTTRHDF